MKGLEYQVKTLEDKQLQLQDYIDSLEQRLVDLCAQVPTPQTLTITSSCEMVASSISIEPTNNFIALSTTAVTGLRNALNFDANKPAAGPVKALPWTSFHSPCQPPRLPSPLSESQHCLPRPCPATSLPLATRRCLARSLSTSLPQATALAPAHPRRRPGPRPRLASHAGSVWSARLSPAPVQPAAPPLPRAISCSPTYMRLATSDLRRYFRRCRLHPHPVLSRISSSRIAAGVMGIWSKSM